MTLHETDAARLRVIDKLAKLKRHAESAEQLGNEAEAQAFAAMVQQLLLKHSLEMTDLEYASTVEAEPVTYYGIDYRKYPDLKLRKARVRWIEELASNIARAHTCTILVHGGSSRITLVGRKSNCEIAEYMFVTLQRLLERMSHRAWWTAHNAALATGLSNTQSRGKLLGFRSAFLHGFIRRLDERYEAERRATEQAYAGSTALVRIDRAPVDDFMAAEAKKGHTQRMSGLTREVSSHAEGTRAGRAAADKVVLDAKAMHGNTTKKLPGGR